MEMVHDDGDVTMMVTVMVIATMKVVVMLTMIVTAIWR